MKPQDVRTLGRHAMLNLPPAARREEVERSYLHLTSVYSENSRACYGAMSEAEREWMVRRIQEAYDTLMSAARNAEYGAQAPQPARGAAMADNAAPFHPAGANGGAGSGRKGRDQAAAQPVFAADAAVSGAHLRNIRLARGATLDEISSMTKVKKAYLEAIESENFKSFPAPVFLKGFLKAYAKALGLDPEEIISKFSAGG